MPIIIPTDVVLIGAVYVEMQGKSYLARLCFRHAVVRAMGGEDIRAELGVEKDETCFDCTEEWK